MGNRFDGRIKRLEALCSDNSILDEFDTQQKKALVVSLSVLDGQEPTEALAHERMSRESYEAALASIPPGLLQRLVGWGLARERAMEEAERGVN